MVACATALLIVQPAATSTAAFVSSGKIDKKEWILQHQKVHGVPHPKANEIFQKVRAVKDKYYLEYTDDEDLLETVNLIVTHADGTFNPYDVTALVLKESKFKRKAISNHGAKGLTQIIKRYWTDVLPKNFDPYNKEHAIKGGVDILHAIKDEHRCDKMGTFRRYNGAGEEAHRYAREVVRLSHELRTMKLPQVSQVASL